MATLVLGAVGTSVAGPVGGFIGATAGSFIDNLVLIPSVFGEQEQSFTGQRVEGLRFSGADEGTPLPYCLGPENRPSAGLIYLSKLREEVTTTTTGGGGKGGGSRQKSKQTTYNYYSTFAVAVCEHIPNGTVEKVWAESKLIFDRNGQVDARYEGITIYNGVTRQFPSAAAQTTADPDIVATKARDGVTTPTPAYKGTCYIVIKELLLKDWGNRVPSVTVLVREKLEKPVKEAIADLWARAGRASNEIDVTSVPKCLRGYTITGPSDVGESLRLLSKAYNIGAQDRGGFIHVFDRANAETITVKDGHLAARLSGQEPQGRPVSIVDPSGTTLPSAVTVKYIEPLHSLQPGLAREHRQSAQVLNKESADFPFSLDAETARAIAKRLLWTSWNERKKITLTLSPQYMDVLEGDILSFNVKGEAYTVRVTNVARGSNFLIQIEGVVQNAGAFSQSAPSDELARDNSRVYSPPAMKWSVLNIPAIAEGDETVGTYYLSAQRIETSQVYAGAVVYRSADAMGTFTSRGALLAEGSVGTVESVLPDFAIPDFIDRGSSIVVTSTRTLASSTLDEVMATRSNALLIGDEIVQFLTVSALGDNRYEISDLIRGRRGTPMTGHMPNDRVIVLDESVFSDTISPNDCGVTQSFKVAAAGALINGITASSSQITCETLRPFPPCFITATGGTGTRTVSWQPRSRGLALDWFTAVPTDLDEERYKIEIQEDSDGSWTTLTDTETDRSYSLTAASRTSAGYASGDDVPIRISQYSSTLGEFGHTQEAIV